MWPSSGSGFEASPFSPAGRAQALWRVVIGANVAKRTRRGLPRWAIVATALFVVAVLVVPLLVTLAQLLF
jgi:hypothetical protein